MSAPSHRKGQDTIQTPLRKAGIPLEKKIRTCCKRQRHPSQEWQQGTRDPIAGTPSQETMLSKRLDDERHEAIGAAA